jgi:hypothetical protein
MLRGNQRKGTRSVRGLYVAAEAATHKDQQRARDEGLV